MFTHSMRRAPRAITLLAAASATLTATLAFAPQLAPPPRNYTIETVDLPFGVPGVDFDTQILWANNSGVITVQYQSPRSPEFLENMHTAILQRGTWTVIDVPGAETSGGTNASNHGQVVLSHQFGDGFWLAAVRRRNGLTTLPDVLGYPGGMIVQGVNDRTQIAAIVLDADGGGGEFFGDARRHAIVAYPGPDVVFTQGNMINNAGVGVGTYLDADGYHAFKWEEGTISNIDPPITSGTEPSATAINNAGVIVGIWYNPDGETTGYVQDGDEITEFAVPDSTYTIPYFINDRGQISGVYGDADGVARGFVATPRPGRRHH